MAPAKQLLGSKPVSARHLRHRCFARKRLRDDLRLDLGRPASPPARPCNHLDPTDVPSVRVKRMVIHMVKPIPMKDQDHPALRSLMLCGEEIMLTMSPLKAKS